MSPFASYLRELRQRRGLKQKEVAELLGYEQSYLSSLEKGLKGLPRRAFMDRLISKLALDSEEVAELDRVLKCSDRRVLLPANASPREYTLLHKVRDLSGCLDDQQIELILGLIQAIAPNRCCSSDGKHGRRATM
jgi:transcriptional regulator with XRE-family HTH domain